MGYAVALIFASPIPFMVAAHFRYERGNSGVPVALTYAGLLGFAALTFAAIETFA